MTDSKLDPPRLLDQPDTDALLQAALRGARERVPSEQQLLGLAQRLPQAGVPHPASRRAVPGVLALVIGGLGVWAGLQLVSVRQTPPTAATKPTPPSAASEVAPPSAAMKPAPPLEARDVAPPTAAAKSAPAASASVPGTVSLTQPALGRTQRASSPAAKHRRAASRPEQSGEPMPPPIAAAQTASASGVQSLPQPNSAPAQRAESELELLARAQGLLGRDPQAALRVIALHAQRYPAGSYRQEREALALDALQRLNRGSELQARARAFLARYPDSPHAERIRGFLR